LITNATVIWAVTSSSLLEISEEHVASVLHISPKRL